MRSASLIKKYTGTLIKEFDYGLDESWWNSNGWVASGYTGDGSGDFGLGSRWSGGTSQTYKKFNGLGGATIHMKIALSHYVANDEGAYRMRFRMQFFSNQFTCNNGFKIDTTTYPLILTYGTNTLNTGVQLTQLGNGAASYHRWMTLDLNPLQATVKLWSWLAGGYVTVPSDPNSPLNPWLTLSDNTNNSPDYTWTIKRGGTAAFDGECMSFYNTQPTGGTYAFISNVARPHELYLII